ncbi:MAG: PAS domain S-box protein [Patescibacteria group bacterium]|jgi:PAS domain S-box-containing protein
MAALIVLGPFYVWCSWESAIADSSRRALLIGNTAATALNNEMLKQLRGVSEDEDTVAYNSVKTGLMALTNTDERIRFVYLYTRRDGKIYFLADSEPTTSEDYSPPGQEYTEADYETVQPFEDGRERITKPAADRWGTWVSILVPMKDEDTGEVRAVLGIDYPADIWNSVARAQAVSAGRLVVAVGLLLYSLFLIQKKTAEREKLADIVESSDDAILTKDIHGIIQSWNGGAEKIYGYTAKEVIGQSVNIIVPKELQKEVTNVLAKVKKGLAVQHYETVRLKKDGGRVDMSLSASPIKNDAGKVSAVSVIGRDITARKRAEEQLAFREALLAAEAESSIDGILVVDNESRRTLLVNKRFGEIWKVPQQIIDTKDDKKMLEYVAAQLKDPKAFGNKVEYLYKHPKETNRDQVELVDGRFLDRYSAPLIGVDKKNYGRIWFFRDITREKQIDTMKSEFVSVASHQLKTPLAGIKWITELLLGDKIEKPSEKQIEYLNDIQSSNNRMLKLVNDLLDVSHIETGRKFEIVKQPTDIAELVGMALKNNQQLAKDKQVTVTICKGAEPKLSLNVDSDKIRQVFENLINNAIKYSKEGGQVEIGCQHGKKEITLSVKDNGIGIPQSQQNRVFEKFFRADNALTQATDGTGLGLYIAKAIVEAHGGKMWFESEENKGTTFFFSLPNGSTDRQLS